jgi:hypothetical protein
LTWWTFKSAGGGGLAVVGVENLLAADVGACATVAPR